MPEASNLDAAHRRAPTSSATRAGDSAPRRRGRSSSTSGSPMRVLAWKAPIRPVPARPIFVEGSSGSNVAAGQRFRGFQARRGSTGGPTCDSRRHEQGRHRSARRSGPGPASDVEVVQVGVRGRDRRAVPAMRHEHDVVGAHLGEHVDRTLARAIDALKPDRISAALIERSCLEVVDLSSSDSTPDARCRACAGPRAPCCPPG